MSKTIAKQGRCLCGSIKIQANTISEQVGACHCKMCQQWGGGPLMAVNCGTDVTIDGGEFLSTFNSSEWAERGFCKQCGTHLFYRLKATQQYMMPVGLFQDGETWVFDHQIFIEQKPEYFEFANETQNLTGEEVFADPNHI